MIEARKATSVLLMAAMSALTACGGGGKDQPANNPTGTTTPTLSIAPASVDEGDAATGDLVFTVSLSAAASSTVSVDFSSADATADQSDYTSVSGQLDIAAGATSGTITVEILGDTIIEADEEFTVALSNPVNATIATANAVGTIRNDDFPLLSIATVSIDEGDSGTTPLTFDITLDQQGIGDISVDYVSSNLVATAGSDFTASNGTVTIPEGDTLVTVDVLVNGDDDIEQDEQFVMNILNASSNARIDVDEANGVIINDDFPKITLGPASVTEADLGTRALAMPITLDAAGYEDLEIGYATADGSAIAGDDYTQASGTVVIPAGDVIANIPVDTLGDTVAENSEAFEVSISLMQGTADIEVGAARGTILDNDGPPSDPQIFGFPTAVAEGDAGTTDMRFLILLDQVQTRDTSVDYSTADVTATAPDDYVATSGTALIPAGMTEFPVDIAINGDTDAESDELLHLLLSNATAGISIVTPQLNGTIADDDTTNQPRPRLTISNSSLDEGDTGAVDMTFALSLSIPATTAVTIDYVTEDDTATAGADYTTVSGTVTFAIGDTTAVINVPVLGDNFTEDNERFRVRLSNLTGDADLGNSIANGTIITDEPVARISISNAGMLEGDSGTQDLLFTVSTFVASVDPITFDYTTADDTALAGEDYVAATGSGQIPAGDFETTIAVTINGDTDNEDDETFDIALDNLSLNATFSDQMATGAVLNDDGSPGWQTPQILGDGYEPDVHMNAQGNGAAVWGTSGGSIPQLDSVNASLITASALTTTTQVDVSRSREPKVTALSGDEVLAVWPNLDVESSLYRGGSWTTTPVLDGLNWFIQLAGNANGDAIAVWQRDPVNTGSYYNLWRARFDPVAGVFLPAELFEFDDTGFTHSLLVDMNAAGDIIIVWTQSFSDFTKTGVYFDWYDASAQLWTGPTKIGGLPLGGLEPNDLVLPDDGRAVLVLRANSSSYRATELWRLDPAGLQWSALGTASAGAPIQRQMGLSAVAVDGNDNVVVVWQQEPQASSGWTMWARHWDDAADDWGSAPIRLEGGGNVYPSDGLDVVADPLGNAIAVWVQNVETSPNFDIRLRAARYAATNQDWGPAEQIDDPDEGRESIDPAIAVDASGNAVVVWKYHPEGKIGANRFVAP